MKIVKEYINEIKRNIEGSGLGALGIGRGHVIKPWAEKKKDRNELASNYTIDSAEYLHSYTIDVKLQDIKTGPIKLNKESLKYCKFIYCHKCMFDKFGNIVPEDKSDFIKKITYELDENGNFNLTWYEFNNNYLYYTALKEFAKYGVDGVKDNKVIDKIKLTAAPNISLEKNGYWTSVFQARYNTPVFQGTTRIAPRTYRINQWGLDYIKTHRDKFEK